MAEITLEQVEKLRSRSDLNYEEARALLERCGGSVLDALIELERRGMAAPPSDGDGGCRTEPGKEEQRTPPPRASAKVVTITGSAWENFWKDAWTLLGRLWDILKHCNIYQLHIFREGRLLSNIPVWVALIMLVVAFYVVVPLAIVGLALGCRYEIGKEG